jgi:hypothetical protein
MSNILSGSQEEKNMVLGEGLSTIKTDVLPFNSSNAISSPSLFSLDESPFADAFKEFLSQYTDLDVGDTVVVTTLTGKEIKEEVLLIEDTLITLKNGWSWDESEENRSITNTEETHLIKNIGVIRCQK